MGLLSPPHPKREREREREREKRERRWVLTSCEKSLIMCFITR
jgi:hypothetical protein